MVETVIVRVAQGSLRGQKVKTEAGATYYSFHAIPYAKPPVGSLRFKVSPILLLTEAQVDIFVLSSKRIEETRETNIRV
jgi:carboxylesterase type B